MKRLLVFALIIMGVIAGTAIGFAADKENTITEQAAKPIQEESQDVVTEPSEELNEEAVIPTTAIAIETDDIARGSDDVREPVKAVETPVANEAVETPAEPVMTVNVPPAQELEIEVPNDWDAFINGDTAPVDETIE